MLEQAMLERKGLGIRLAAAVIDGVIVAVATTVLAQVLGVVGLIVGSLAALAYPAIEVLKAQSPGKMILKLTVTAADGSPATRDQLVRRSLVRYAPTLAGAVLGLAAVVVPTLAMLGNLVVLAAAIALLVVSYKTLQTTRQAFWDVRAGTAVMGPITAATVPAAAMPPAIPPTLPQQQAA